MIPMTALGGAAPRSRRHGALSLVERPDIALASLALRRGAVAPAPGGLVLPGPGGLASADGLAAFWTGPGQWMVEAAGQAEADFAAALAAMAPGCSVTEQTDGWACFEVAGDAAALEALAERLVNLPAAALAPGRATRTVLHHMGVFALRRDPGCLALWGMRSAAGSLWHALDQAALRLTAFDET
nr:sarcosine oxidase subunit gamma [Mangrovicoccus algicola]